MAYKRINNFNYIFVLLIALSLWVLPLPACGDVLFFEDSHGPAPKKTYLPATYSFSEGTDFHLARFQGELIKRAPSDTREDMLVNMKVGYGRLFLPSIYGYKGVGYFTAKLDSDNRLRFNSSLGHFLPVVGGELFFTHRLLRNNLSIPMQNSASIEDEVYENSFSVNYSRFFNRFIREASLNYSISFIPGQEFGGSSLALDSENTRNTTQIWSGYSDTTVHAIEAQIAFGSEDIDIDFISGFKTSLNVGYDYGEHGAFHDHPGQIIKRFSASATLEQQTSVGLFTTSYKHAENTRILHAGYLFRGVELYFKNTMEKDRDDTQLFGFKLQLNLKSLKLPLREKAKTFFRNASSFYKGLNSIGHITRIDSDSFAAKPQIHEVGGS